MSKIPTINPNGPFSKELLRDGQIVAIALQLSNDRWALYDINEIRLNKSTYASAKQARDAFVKMETAASAATEDPSLDSDAPSE